MAGLASHGDSVDPPGYSADPLERIFALGERATRIGIAIGIVGAIALHVMAGYRIARTLWDINEYASAVYDHVRAELRSKFDFEMDQPPPPPPPEPEPPPPEPEPEPKAKLAAPPPEAEPPPEPPPPAQAANVLTDPNEAVDLTGNGMVVGNAETYAGGVTTKTGTSKVAVRDTRATPGATGNPAQTTPKVAAAVSAVDRSRPPEPLEKRWDCGFPKEADADGIDNAVVQVAVTIGMDGKPVSANVLKDPGSGFGRLAQRCALGKGYAPGWDSAGKPIPSTRIFSIRFYR